VTAALLGAYHFGRIDEVVLPIVKHVVKIIPFLIGIIEGDINKLVRHIAGALVIVVVHNMFLDHS
jgi:hypothetical protein